MKKRILAAVAIVGLNAAVAYSAPTATAGQGVLNSVHDMRVSANITDIGGNDRVCAFCHTPHHAIKPAAASSYAPLWSRMDDQQTFVAYQSATFDSTVYSTGDAAAGPTRLCMTCHDGSIALDQHYGSANTGTMLTNDNFGGPGVGVNKDLSNDHPVGFDYMAIAAGCGDSNICTTAGTATTPDQYNYIRKADQGLTYRDNPANIKVADRLYNGSIMTCATCHDVHNKKNLQGAETMNYLVLAPQKDSALCLTCHIK
ncbi:cytochrome C [Oryzomonas sagensis]|uniref:Cytochrome C n=1 Tax=Oryzomonas sagensis TaxID=2603857 RepID=A0ABQ6TR43_9BACT|nr:cytochrome C [Oryzomonas sagensis]KAB0671468.1 cytochrome C [Oryzomonas sagensis]